MKLAYRLRESFDDHCHEQIHHHHRNQEHERDEVEVGDGRPTPLNALPLDRLVGLVGRALLRARVLAHQEIPFLSCSTTEQEQQSGAEGLEVGVVGDVVPVFDRAEQVNPHSCINEKEQEYQHAYVRQRGDYVDQGLRDYLEVLRGFDETHDPHYSEGTDNRDRSGQRLLVREDADYDPCVRAQHHHEVEHVPARGEVEEAFR